MEEQKVTLKLSSKGGTRSSKIKEINLIQIKRLAETGCTDAEMAAILGVWPTLIKKWKDEHPEFREAYEQGRMTADQKVVGALLKRATGYKRKVTKAFCSNGVIVTKEIKEDVPPSDAAIQFWLKNRQPDRWKEKQEIKHSLGELSEEEVELELQRLREKTANAKGEI